MLELSGFVFTLLFTLYSKLKISVEKVIGIEQLVGSKELAGMTLVGGIKRPQSLKNASF